ncbi:hypothetical protein K466DRAFT_570260 [Polyporus arcularius HHB13444]|uniref:Uncharacterized protein n=1 Tax=Polyporus arcularius HHB13444 TaxID=1314778 RepID=A0A5C3NRL9_9APHY|nr:hypothetical protein K466DRAFT_570260 [Polyporus arcularius HHB13444]
MDQLDSHDTCAYDGDQEGDCSDPDNDCGDYDSDDSLPRMPPDLRAWWNSWDSDICEPSRTPPESPEDYLLKGFRAYSEEPGGSVKERAAQALLRVAVAAAHAAYKIQHEDVKDTLVGEVLAEARQEIARKVEQVTDVHPGFGNSARDALPSPSLRAAKRQCIRPPVPPFHQSRTPGHAPPRISPPAVSHHSDSAPANAPTIAALYANSSSAQSVANTSVSASATSSASAAFNLRTPFTASTKLRPFRTPSFGHVGQSSRRGSEWDIRIGDDSKLLRHAKTSREHSQVPKEAAGYYGGACEFPSDFAHLRGK